MSCQEWAEFLLKLAVISAGTYFWCWFLVYQPTQYLTKKDSKWGKGE